MNLKILPQNFSVCKISDLSQINWNDPFLFLSKTDEELSLVCSTNSVPTNCTHQENEWKAFRIEGILDFSLVGILANISYLLAKEKISIFAISTFNTDYILVRNKDWDQALKALHHAGYTVI